MAHKFKVGDKVNHFSKGDGFVAKYDFDIKTAYPIRVSFESEDYTFTREGRLYEDEEISLRLTGRPFNVGDRVVVGGEKGVIAFISKGGSKTPVNIELKSASPQDEIWLTADGRAWPGTPIICEHDWEEEAETIAEKAEKGINALGEAVAICGVYGKELQRVAEIQEQEAIADKKEEVNKELDEAVKSSQAFYEYNNQETENHAAAEIVYSLLKEQHKYARMALKLTGFEVDKEAAALITETVKKVLELGDEFSIKTACEIEARVNQIYDEPNI